MVKFFVTKIYSFIFVILCKKCMVLKKVAFATVKNTHITPPPYKYHRRVTYSLKTFYETIQHSPVGIRNMNIDYWNAYIAVSGRWSGWQGKLQLRLQQLQLDAPGASPTNDSDFLCLLDFNTFRCVIEKGWDRDYFWNQNLHVHTKNNPQYFFTRL